MFSFFEARVDSTATPVNAVPPDRLGGFYWHFIGQTPWLFIAIFATGLGVAFVDTMIPFFIGKLVGVMTGTDREAAITEAAPVLISMALIIFLGRPLIMLLDNLVRHNAINPGVTTAIRWQSHWHVARQSLAFFQDDFAGRIANRVMGTANAVRESVVSAIRGVWYISMYGVSTIALMSWADPRLAIPTILWIVGYVFFLRYFVPRMRKRGKLSAMARSALMGRIVDTYSNMLTVKLFARADREDDTMRESVQDHRFALNQHMRIITSFMLSLVSMNALLVGSTAAISVWLWVIGDIEVAVVAMALPLAWQISNLAGWVSWEIAGIFENISTVQEGMQTIAVPHKLRDIDGAADLTVDRGEITFDHVSFNYDGGKPVFDSLDLHIKPGEKIGLVGRSGAGKSTLVSLLLRFFDIERGKILIDGRDVSQVTQESLRASIGVVTQDTSLLHRSIADNISYGYEGATPEQIEQAARTAQAHEFIVDQLDANGAAAYDAKVGERGVKLSGGQRQRIAIARVILKNAPILVLDEATSALDSEIEAAIQEQLEGLMQGKTVIAIAHRLSTIARMDRLIVLDQGHIVEQGTHAQLLEQGGHYASLWTRQSGGFLGGMATQTGKTNLAPGAKTS